MLVLSRRQGESVMIGDGVVVTVLEVRGDVVRIGVNAPRDVQVHREEVWRELQEANKEAASPSEAAVDALSRLLPGAPPPARGPSRDPAPAGGQDDDAVPPAPPRGAKPRDPRR